ncbi:LysR substrate-binding domain-containing protein [Achromobacter mucicolens]|jgi:DNA-binding transcriptional LysR family regulator|uniref:Glycine cleavage system transcriptional activator n=2 Tax=Achromobacter mucicolens TaxID=1389922 RepID=A0ABM8LA66_9BURK|nr:LysR substrate-binding domain-containing protein [uncultured Achromobacter sp.]CAB3841831.1 Glycine cleavage system transcriptional activator [Achromobacter mucicolens]
MRLHSPSMSELHAFAAVVRLGSFSQAADELCVTQGAISRAVARLEAHFNQVLLQRDSHRLQLTEAGRAFLDAVQEPLMAIEAASAGLRTAPADRPLSLAVVPTFASVWLVPRLPEFRRLHPDVRLNFAPYRKGEDFSDNTADAAILTGLGQHQWPGWHCDYVIGREIVPVCHPERLARMRAEGRWREPHDLAAEPLLYHTTAPGNWTQWLRWAGPQAPAPNLSMACDQVSILVRAAIADMGIALVQRCLVRHELETGQLAVPFDLPITLERGYFLCIPSNRRPPPGYGAFRDWLLAAARQDIENLMRALDSPQPP